MGLIAHFVFGDLSKPVYLPCTQLTFLRPVAAEMEMEQIY